MYNVKETSKVEFSSLLSSFEYELNNCALSPTISQLDHQEVVETKFYGDRLLGGDVITGKSVTNTNFDSDFSNVGHSLFSFEVDTNTLSPELFAENGDNADFDWTYLLPDSGEPVSLEDIIPSHFLNCESNKEAGLKERTGVGRSNGKCNRFQRNSLGDSSKLEILKSYYKSRVVQQKPISCSSSAHYLSDSKKCYVHSNCVQLNEDFDLLGSDYDRNISYENTQVVNLNNKDLQNGIPGQLLN
ncbi:unnamed protein product [Trichobilharzia szidati]|nr:unnamed protein product [Trichobilharzia szidati]